MQITVLGTGMVGRAIAGALSGLGHQVTVGTRDPEATLARTDPDQPGAGSYAAWLAEHPQIRLVALTGCAVGADMVVNATSGTATLAVLAEVGPTDLVGTVVLDLANPLDFSAGFPPTLTVKDTDSLGEQVQRALPAARVVKALNTLNADLMVDPGRLPEGTSVFVCGDDADAKAQVGSLLGDLGHTDVIDLGGIEAARGTEMYLPLWLRLMGALGTATFNVRVVR